jgi:hypothetical protein
MVAWSDRLVRFPAGCSTWRCVWCGPQKGRRKAEIVAWAQPERFLTLTQAPPDWQACRQKVRKLALRLREAGRAVEWAWTVEKGKQTGMIHVHLLQHGDYLPQRELQAMWGRRVDVRRISDVDGAARYTTKHAARRLASYTMKGATAQLAEHLDLNGGRGVHLSRGYLRGYRSDEVWRLLHPASALDWLQVPAHLSDAEAAAMCHPGVDSKSTQR